MWMIGDDVLATLEALGERTDVATEYSRGWRAAVALLKRHLEPTESEHQTPVPDTEPD